MSKQEAIKFEISSKPSVSIPRWCYDAVCKIQTEHLQGTAFLLEFTLNKERRCGLITCHHAPNSSSNQSSSLKNSNTTSNLNNISLTLQGQQPICLAWIAKSNSQPVSDASMNFLYVDITTECEKLLRDQGIGFLTHRENADFDRFLLVHYWNGERASLMGQLVGPTSRKACRLANGEHLASTMKGICGAPLLQSSGREGYVVAMYSDTDVDHNIAYATRIERIIDRIARAYPTLQTTNLPAPMDVDGLQSYLL